MITDKSLSILAIAASFVALGISSWQAWDSRKFNRLTIDPYLQTNPKLTGDSETGLYLENAGTGTAFINKIDMFYDGKKYNLTNDSSIDFFKAINVNPDCFRQSWPRKGAALQSGKEFPLVRITNADTDACHLVAAKFLTQPGIEMTIGYTTPYREEREDTDEFALTERELGAHGKTMEQLRNLMDQ